MVLSPHDRFWAKVDVRGLEECWPWTASTNGWGYGQFGVSAAIHKPAHIFAWEELYGPVSDGFELDHTCHNETDCPGGSTCPHRLCCNVAHLEEVTHQVNMLRGKTIAAMNAAKTHCVNDHQFTPENTYVWDGDRYCRTCRRERRRKVA